MNNTTAYELNCFTALNYSALVIGETIAFCLIFVVSLVGNSAIALIVYKTQSMRKPTNYFIANMAVSDLLFPIILFPMEMAESFYGSWPISGAFGEAWCKMTAYLPEVSSSVSVQSLVLIAVDRFGAVVFPLRSPLITPKLCPLYIFATWIVALAVNSPFLFAFRLVQYQGKVYCDPQWKEAFGETFSFENYFLSLTTFSCYIPITLLIVFYSIILIKLKLQKSPGEQSVNADEQRARRNRAVLKMAIAIVIGFTLCHLPWRIIRILLFFAWDSRLPPCNIGLYRGIFWYMIISYCAVNPCICCIFSGNYRQGFKKLLKCNK